MMKASAESKSTALLSLGSLHSAPSLTVAAGGSEAAMGAGGMAASTALKVGMYPWGKSVFWGGGHSQMEHHRGM